MDNFDLKKYLAEGRLFEEKKGGFAFWYRSGARGKKNALQARELLTQKGIDADYSKGPYYIDFSKSDAEESVVTQLLQDANLTNYVILRDAEDLAEGRLLKEEIMVDTTIMFGGNDYIKDVLTSPDDFGFDVEDTRWIKSNILTAPKTMSIEDYMALEDEWVKQANLDVGTGADRESVLDAIDVHVKQGLITPEEGKTAKKIALNF